jgi:hypothetical protein
MACGKPVLNKSIEEKWVSLFNNSFWLFPAILFTYVTSPYIHEYTVSLKYGENMPKIWRQMLMFITPKNAGGAITKSLYQGRGGFCPGKLTILPGKILSPSFELGVKFCPLVV